MSTSLDQSYLERFLRLRLPPSLLIIAALCGCRGERSSSHDHFPQTPESTSVIASTDAPSAEATEPAAPPRPETAAEAEATSADTSVNIRLATWDATQEDVPTLECEGGCTDLKFFDSGKQIALSDGDGYVHVWSLQPSERTIKLKGWVSHAGLEGPVIGGRIYGLWCVALSPDGSMIAAGGSANLVKLWSLPGGDVIMASDGKNEDGAGPVERHTRNIWAVAFSHDGAKLAAGGEDRAIRVWDVGKPIEPLILRGHEGGVSCVGFSLDDKWIASGGGWDDGTVRLWDPTTGELLLTYRGHKTSVKDLAVSPDGNHIASADWDGVIRIWHALTGQEVATLRGHEDGLHALVYSPDGRRIASGDEAGVLRIWDASKGEQLLAIGTHNRGISSLAFSSDGAWIATGTSDGPVKLWEVPDRPDLVEKYRLIHERHRLAIATKQLDKAAFAGDVQKVASAIRDGADANGRDSYGLTPLFRAAGQGHVEVVRMLLENGADVSAGTQSGNTPLHEACRRGRRQVVSLLIEKGADFQCRDKKRESPLMKAAANGHLDICQRLVRLGADTAAKDAIGKNTLIHAVQSGNLGLVRLLVSNGSELDAVDQHGMAPLMYAARGDALNPDGAFLAIVKFLVERGASTTAVDEAGLNPLGHARQGDEFAGNRYTNQEVIEFLRSLAGSAEANE